MHKWLLITAGRRGHLNNRTSYFQVTISMYVENLTKFPSQIIPLPMHVKLVD